jgi:hypothetical protein
MTYYRKLLPFIILTTVLLLCSLSCADQEAATQEVPDVVVLIMSGFTPQDMVCFTYPSVVAKEEVQKDVDALKSATGWPMGDINVSTGSVETDGKNPMTSVEFTAPFVVNREAGSVLVEPFLKTFRNHKLVEIDYIIEGAFNFRGLRNFTNDKVDIAFEQTGNSIRYRAKIRDINFDELNLPLVVEEDSIGQDVDKGRNKSGGLTLLKVLAALGIALIVGSVVYALSGRFSRTK